MTRGKTFNNETRQNKEKKHLENRTLWQWNQSAEAEQRHETKKLERHNGMRNIFKVEEVAERVTDAMCSWMNVESRIVAHATWDNWFNSSAEQTEGT